MPSLDPKKTAAIQKMAQALSMPKENREQRRARQRALRRSVKTPKQKEA